MDRQVKITVQRWEPQGRGRTKIKIAEKHFNITTLTHKGVPYVVTKKHGRGRYTVKRDPAYAEPAPTVSETFTPSDLTVDVAPEPLAHPPDRAPMIYAEEVLP